MPQNDPIDVVIKIDSVYNDKGAKDAVLDAQSLQHAYASVPTVNAPKAHDPKARQNLSAALAQAIEATNPENQPVPDLHPADLIDSDVLRALANHNPHHPLRSEVANAIYKRAFDQGRQAQDLDVEDLLKLLDPLDDGAAVGLAAVAWDRGNKERCTILPFGPDKLAELQKQAVDEFLHRHSQPDPFDDALPADDDASPSPFAPADEFSRRRLLDQWGDDAERISDDLEACADTVEESTAAASNTTQELRNAATSSAQIPAQLDTCYESVPLISQALDAVAVASKQAADVSETQLEESKKCSNAQALSAATQAEWAEVSRRSNAEQQAWLEKQIASVQVGSDLWKKYNDQLKQVRARGVAEAIGALEKEFQVTGRYAAQDNRTQSQILQADMRSLQARRARLQQLLATPDLDAATIAKANEALEATNQQIRGCRQAMQQNTNAARRWLKELQPPKLQGKSKMAQRALGNLGKQYKRAAAKAAKAAEKGDTKALERAQKQMGVYARGMSRLAKNPAAAERMHRSAMGHLKDAQGSSAQTAAAEKKAAKGAQAKAAAQQQAADAAKKQIPKGQPAKTANKVADLSAQVKDQKAQIERLTNEVKDLCGKITGLGDAAASAASAAAQAATVAAQAATAADRAIDRTKKEIAECRKAIERLNRK